jgi:hypothetical protein
MDLLLELVRELLSSSIPKLANKEVSCIADLMLSVTGLSIDYIVASVIGFLCYSLFALCMYTVPAIKAEYRRRHHDKDNLVALNDVIFAVDAFFITSVMLIQVIIYRVFRFAAVILYGRSLEKSCQRSG